VKALWLSASLLLCVACAQPSPTKGAPASSDSESPTSSPIETRGDGQGFHPQTFAEGDWIVVPFTLLDGTTGELVYPADLGLTGGSDGVTLHGSGSVSGFGRDFAIESGTPDDVRRRYGNVRVLGAYEDERGGTVEVWTFGNEHWLDYLVFGFDSWTLMVWDQHPDAAGEQGAARRMSEPDRELWATNLRGHETADGFLELMPVPPLRLAEAGPYGPSFSLSDPDPGRGLSVGRCDHEFMEEAFGQDLVRTADGKLLIRQTPKFARWCDEGTGLYVDANGPPDFVDRAIEGVEFRDVVLSSPPA